MIAQLQTRPRADAQLHLLQQVHALDSTFLRLSPTRSVWTQPTATHPGAWLQLGLALACPRPSLLALTTNATNDVSDLAALDLAPYCGQTLLCDLGYYAHRQLERLRRAGVHFILRRKPQARVDVLAPLPSAPAGEAAGGQVLADELIRLGSPHNRAGTVLHGLRRVTWQASDGRVFKFVTDRFDLPAGQVAWLYRQRWTIACWFRFLKQTVGLIRPLGTSREAVWLTIVISLIVAVVLMVLAGLPPGQWPEQLWVRLLGLHLVGAMSLAPG